MRFGDTEQILTDHFSPHHSTRQMATNLQGLDEPNLWDLRCQRERPATDQYPRVVGRPTRDSASSDSRRPSRAATARSEAGDIRGCYLRLHTLHPAFGVGFRLDTLDSQPVGGHCGLSGFAQNCRRAWSNSPSAGSERVCDTVDWGGSHLTPEAHQKLTTTTWRYSSR
jgi:hypothetical protein